MKTIANYKDEDEVQRPEVLQRLYDVRAVSAVKKPKEFDMFQMHVAENNVQLARFDFLQVRSYFEGCQVGPSNPGVPMQGATSLQMMFKYYAARRQNNADGGNFETLEAIQEANRTMDLSELTKFMKEFLPGVFIRKEINWMFKMANLMEHGLSDEAVFTMDFEEFVGILCQIAMQLYRGHTPKQMAKKLGARLGLDDPLKMRAKLRQMGKLDAGFGAWKSDEGTIGPQKYDPKARFPLGTDAGKYCLDHHNFLTLKLELLKTYPDVKIPEWLPFPGPFIAFVFPVKGVRKGKRIRFKLAVRNIAPRAIELHPRLVDLPNVSMTQSDIVCSIAPGMDMTIVISVEEILPMGQVGGLVFSAEDSGPELFRCPIYLRPTTASKAMVGDHICSEIADDADPQEMRTKFKSHDHGNSGRVSVDMFQKVVDDLGFVLADELKAELTKQVEVEKSETDDSILVDYDDFVDRISDLARKSRSKRRESLHSQNSSLSKSPTGKRAGNASPSVGRTRSGSGSPQILKQASKLGIAQGHSQKLVLRCVCFAPMPFPFALALVVLYANTFSFHRT